MRECTRLTSLSVVDHSTFTRSVGLPTWFSQQGCIGEDISYVRLFICLVKPLDAQHALHHFSHRYDLSPVDVRSFLTRPTVRLPCHKCYTANGFPLACVRSCLTRLEDKLNALPHVFH